MNRRLFTVFTGLAACVAVLIGGLAEALAQTDAIADGNWSELVPNTTWSAGEPAATTDANIDGSFTVTVNAAGEVAGTLDVGSIVGQTGNLDVDAPGALTLSTLMRVGFAGTGVVDMTGGTVTVNGGFGTPLGIGDLIVGDAGGNGTVNQSGGTFTASDEMFIGLGGGSVGVVNVSGGTLSTAPGGRSILVGLGGGDGTLDVSGTGDVDARFDLLVGLDVGSTATINQSGGTIDAGFLFTNAFVGGAGNTVTMTQTGGTFTTRIAYVLGQGNGTTTQDHSGGTINALLGGAEFVVGDGGGNSSTYNISGTADVNVGRNFVAGRDGIGVVNMSGGTIDATNVFLGDFDSSTGTMTITGGTLNLTGNFNVGAALASNASPTRVEPDGFNGPQGQALDANGVLIVSGNGGDINIGGNFLANPSDKSTIRGGGATPNVNSNSATLVFELFSASGTSLIDVTGIADLDGAVIDLDLMGGYTPSFGQTFDLLTAASFGSTGLGTTENVGTGQGYTLAAEDVGAFNLAVVPDGNGSILRATFVPEPATMALAASAVLALVVRRRRSVDVNLLV